MCAMGYSGVQFDPEKVDLYFESRAGKLKIIENGVSTGYDEAEATKILSEDEVTAIADMKMGDATATAWGCDLTYDYVKINADYRVHKREGKKDGKSEISGKGRGADRGTSLYTAF